MINSQLRIGNFTSSEIYRLVSKGKSGGLSEKALTYIEEKNMERRMLRSVDTEVHTKDMAWGNFLEQRVLDLLGTEYQMTSKTTDLHPTVPNWAGSKDLIVEGVKISEIKCYQPKNFCTYTDALLTQDTEVIKKECPKEYWQLVSNACILGLNVAEAITYMPYKSELDEIRQMALDYTDIDQWKYRFIYEGTDEQLAHLPDNGYYKNLNVFAFTIPEADKDLLQKKVIEASKILAPFYAPSY